MPVLLGHVGAPGTGRLPTPGLQNPVGSLGTGEASFVERRGPLNFRVYI